MTVKLVSEGFAVEKELAVDIAVGWAAVKEPDFGSGQSKNLALNLRCVEG